MASRPNVALDVALGQRQRLLDQARKIHSERDRAATDQLAQVHAAEARVNTVLLQMDAAQRPALGMQLPVEELHGMESMLDWCEVHVEIAHHRLAAAQKAVEESRGFVALAHQQVRALELVLEARAAEAAEKVRRVELRDADETAARVHARNAMMAR
jgi:flagellar biosynthesis chaperone FliJ